MSCAGPFCVALHCCCRRGTMAVLVVLMSLLVAGEDPGGRRGALQETLSCRARGRGAAAGVRQRGGCRSAGKRRQPRPSRLPLGLLSRPACGGEAWRSRAGPNRAGLGCAAWVAPESAQPSTSSRKVRPPVLPPAPDQPGLFRLGWCFGRRERIS